MMRKISLLGLVLGVLKLAFGAKIEGSSYSAQSGTQTSGGIVTHFDEGDYMTYDSVDFGSTGSTKGIILNHSKANYGGAVEIRLGDKEGPVIAEFTPAKVGSNWNQYHSAYIGITDVTGVQDITFVGKDGSSILNLAWFELSDFLERSETYARIPASQYSDQRGTSFHGPNTSVGWFDKNDYMTYSSVNFGERGTTFSLNLRYAKANHGGRVEIRLGGPDGKLIGEYKPANTNNNWHAYETVNVGISGVEGIHDLTFVGRDVNGVWNLLWFEFSDVELFRFTSRYRVDDNKDNARDVQCKYDTVFDSWENTIFFHYDDGTATSEEVFFDQLGVSNKNEAIIAVENLCKSAQEGIDEHSFDDITVDEGAQFIELHYNGHAKWNEETETKLFPSDGTKAANVLKDDAYYVKDYKSIAEKSVFKLPEHLAQFDPSVCKAHAAQCCWPRDRQAKDNNGNCNTEYDTNCIDKDVGDNTDLCYNELDKSPYANGIDANGFSIYGDEGPIHCHGFAWSPDEAEITNRFKGNALFFVSMYDHMYVRGYVENIPGSPMCGCVEHMPVVSRSDCTQTNVQEYYEFSKNENSNGFTGSVTKMSLQFEACQGANNKNNNLEAFVQQLVNDGKQTTAEQDVFKTRVVGDNNCGSATSTLLDDHGFQKGYEIDDTKWTFIVGEGFEGQKYLDNPRIFREMVEAQGDQPIVRRVCPSCRMSHRDIYYRRLTPMPSDFDLLDTLMHNWFDKDNKLNEDFALYSSYYDAYMDTNRWTFCNYNDRGIGFPRDCGPTGRVNSQWNSYTRSGGDANHHAFLLPFDPDFESDIEYHAGASYSAQNGTQTSGSIVTDFDEGDYMTYDSVDFGSGASGASSGSTKGIILNHSKANHGGTVEIRLGDKEGPVIAEFTPAKVGSNWNQYHSAYIGITDVTGVQDITFVGKDGSDILNLAWFELSDFPERSETYARIPASQYSDQRGTSFHGPNTSVGWFDKNDYMTYSSVNFGTYGSTNSLNLRYAKANHGGRVEIRLGGPDGWPIGEYKPANTNNNWHAYETVNVGISGVEGIHDLTFVGRDVNGVWNLLWFEPSSNGETKSNVPSATPTSSPQQDPTTDSPTQPTETSEPTSASTSLSTSLTTSESNEATSEPSSIPSSNPSSIPSSSPTVKVEDLCTGKTKAQCPKATCRFNKKKKIKVCDAVSKHDCSVHQSENACNSTNAGVCKWNDGVCSHQCSGLAVKACKKIKSSVTNAKICKLKKISNECFGCNSKTIC